MQRLSNDNTRLLKNLQELTKQVDLRMLNLHRKGNLEKVSKNTNLSTNEEVDMTNNEKMNDISKKIKYMKKQTLEIYKALESTYKNSKLIEMENLVKNQRKIMKEQEEQMKDNNRVIRRMMHLGKVKDQTAFTEDVEVHYTEAKKNLRDLKDEFRKKDNKLKEEH